MIKMSTIQGNPVQKTVQTRFCILSDTHSQTPRPENSPCAFRRPLPTCDVILHAGDLTMTGRLEEYQEIFDVLASAAAELKIVIAGNHDITLDEEFYIDVGQKWFHQNRPEDLSQVREMWTGARASQAGIMYLEEGTTTFQLKNGARFTIYSSQFQPEFYTWAFNYPRSLDRFNPSPPVARVQALNPVPAWPQIDIMLTHGPPHGILDLSRYSNELAGCEHLRRAVQRCRPRLHCFGHIHEGWGGERMHWPTKTSERVQVDQEKVLQQRSAYIDLTESGTSPLIFGEETVFVNAAILDVNYRPRNAPWVIDLDLPFAGSVSDAESMEEVEN